MLGFALGFAVAELVLRWYGHGPWRFAGRGAHEPTMHEPDPELGWRARAGSFTVPPYSADSQAVHLTFRPGGARLTGPAEGDRAGANVLFVGCSFTQGWAISDDETFAWKIQQRFPSVRVHNYGTAGYSTYQSLLVLERALASADPPEIVFYGFIEPHEPRNVATPAWLLYLSLATLGKTPVSVPYCTLSAKGTLERHAPEAFPAWPLHEHLATVAFLEQAYVNLRARGRAEQARAVTGELIAEMDARCRARGVRFVVVTLAVSDGGEAHYSELFRRRGIDSISCPLLRGHIVRGDGHPDGEMNSRWTECIGTKLAAVLSAEHR